MASRIITKPGRTFQEFSLLPGLTRRDCTITNEVKGINRVVYDISSKPPGTIEFE